MGKPHSYLHCGPLPLNSWSYCAVATNSLTQECTVLEALSYIRHQEKYFLRKVKLLVPRGHGVAYLLGHAYFVEPHGHRCNPRQAAIISF